MSLSPSTACWGWLYSRCPIRRRRPSPTRVRTSSSCFGSMRSPRHRAGSQRIQCPLSPRPRRSLRLRRGLPPRRSQLPQARCRSLDPLRLCRALRRGPRRRGPWAKADSRSRDCVGLHPRRPRVCVRACRRRPSSIRRCPRREGTREDPRLGRLRSYRAMTSLGRWKRPVSASARMGPTSSGVSARRLLPSFVPMVACAFKTGAPPPAARRFAATCCRLRSWPGRSSSVD